MHEVIVGIEGVTFQLARDLTYALPLLCLVGIGVQIWPSRFGVLGSPAARAGLAQIAGQHMQYTAGETVHWSAGKDQNLAVMGALRVHTGQGLGIVAGLQQGGADSGLDLISATGDVHVQAQHDILRVQAQKDITIGSAQTNVEYAAPKRIHIATAAGASIVLEGGNITVTAPGRIDVKTGNKQFAGPDRMPYAFPQFTVCKQCVLDAHDGVQSITDKA